MEMEDELLGQLCDESRSDNQALATFILPSSAPIQVHHDKFTGSHRNQVRLDMPQRCWRGVVAGSTVSQMTLPSLPLPCLCGALAKTQGEIVER